MTPTLEDSFERCCRLCAEEQDVTVMIFSQEAEAMHLRNKLNQYLLIEVNEDDKLPKNICIQCCTKLQTVCNFIDTARKAQEILLQRSFKTEQIIPNKCLISLVKTEVKPKSEEHAENDKYAEMEVSVDPMTVFQISEHCLSPTLEHGHGHMEDVTHLHGLHTENVTIKLIKKSVKHFDSGDEEKKNPSPKSPISDDICEDDDKDKSNVKPFQCPTCDHSFYSDLVLKNHSWVHISESMDDKPYTCHTCSEGFNNKCDLISHLKKHSTNGTCQLCGRMFRSERTYIAHMSVHSPSSKSYTCKTCGRSYNTWGSLKTHSVTHSSDRPYQCKFCMKTFKRNQDLKFHINQHTGAKPYKCPFCERCFASSGNCYSHRSRMHPDKKQKKNIYSPNQEVSVQRVKSPPQPKAPEPSNVPNYISTVNSIVKYQCHLCQQTFKRKENFSYHMYQHTGAKPFRCTYCTDTFVTKRGLQIHHESKHHGENWSLGLISKNVLLK